MEQNAIKTIEYLCDELDNYININSKDSNCDIPLPNPLPINDCSNNCKNKNKNKNKWNKIYNPHKNVKEWWEGLTLETEVIESGHSDKRPCYGDKVVIDYVIKLLDGRGIDWSRRPYKFIIGDNSIMEGLSKGVCRMRLGEKAKLFIPYGMAYGWKSSLLSIPEASDIVMTVTLRKIKSNNCNMCVYNKIDY